jgi:hypothetical protein
VYFIKNEDKIISSRNKKKSQGNIFLGFQNKILEKGNHHDDHEDQQ